MSISLSSSVCSPHSQKSPTSVLSCDSFQNGTTAYTCSFKKNVKEIRYVHTFFKYLVHLLSRVQLFATPMDCSTPGFPVLHHLPEFAQTHVHWIGDAVQPSHSMSSPSPTFSLSQHQGLFQGVSSLHPVAKVLKLQLQHQFLQWIFRVDFL